MRRGVVMIMTLALIMMLTLAVLKSTTITQKYITDMSDTMFFAQFNRTFLDMGVIVEELGREIKDEDMFAVSLKMPLIISDEKSKIEGILRLSSAASKFNINQLIDKDNNSTINQTLYDTIYSITREYQLSDGLFFMSLLLDTLDNDKEERAFESEFTYLENSTLSDGAILNQKAFKKIQDFYAKARSDGNIYKIPWDKIIAFSGEKIDYNYLTSKIKAILDENYGINEPYDDSLIKNDDDLSLNDEQKKVMKDLNIKYYVPIYLCDFEFHFLDKSMNIVFKYNLQTRRMSNIETTF